MTGLTSLHLSDISDFVNGDPDSDPDSDQEDDPFFARSAWNAAACRWSPTSPCPG